MPDYQKGCIYMIKHQLDYNNENVYIGSCCNFIRRKCNHKSVCNNPNSNRYNLKLYQEIREKDGWDCWNMIKIHEFPCNSKNELNLEERRVIDEYQAKLNCHIPTRTKIEWCEENADKLKEYRKIYYEENKDKDKEYRNENADRIKEIKKKWRDENKDRIKENRKKYYEENKDKDKEYREENADKLKEYRKKWREENKDRIKENRKKYYEENRDKIKKWREENRDKINENHKKWREENKDKKELLKQL